MNRQLLLITALLTTAGISFDAWAQAGRIQFSSGEVTVQRSNGRSINAFKGLAVDEGDTVVTGGDGQAQLKMVDEALIALRANTELRVDTYRYVGREDGNEQSVLGLLRGAFRSITGAIGRLNRDAYRVRTPTATIGIRGTDHETAYIPPDAQAIYPDADPGTYNLVHSGLTFIEANGQRVELAANQAGFAALAPNIAPARLPVIPPFLRGPGFGPQAGPRGAAHRGPDGPRRPRPGQRPVHPGASLPPPPGSVPPPAPGTFDPRQLPPGFVVAGPGTPLVGGDLSPGIVGSGAGVVGVNPITGEANFAVLNELGLVAQFGSNGFNYSRLAAPLVDQGSTTVGSETVRWGVYAGGEIKDGLGVRQPLFFHHMVAGSITPPAVLAAAVGTGGITFSTIGGFTKPITENGGVGGSVNGASITIIDAGAAIRVTNYSIAVTDSLGRSWNGSTPAGLPGGVTLADFIGGPGMPLGVSCSTCAGGQTGIGSAHGVPIGATAPVGVISSYDLHVGTAAVTGSVLVQ